MQSLTTDIRALSVNVTKPLPKTLTLHIHSKRAIT